MLMDRFNVCVTPVDAHLHSYSVDSIRYHCYISNIIVPLKVSGLTKANFVYCLPRGVPHNHFEELRVDRLTYESSCSHTDTIAIVSIINMCCEWALHINTRIPNIMPKAVHITINNNRVADVRPDLLAIWAYVSWLRLTAGCFQDCGTHSNMS